ncbi:MAG: relaxase, partial [Lachnospiraceae bacterium]|nr:relaxase [Lachnospiraceae bacterium]
MAATRLIPMHINKNHTMGECIKARTDYAANPEKTEKGELVTGYECNPLTVDEEFLLSKTEYEHKTG